ncbi:hypothetical protein FDP41_005920 [Naegleria fowleri]|uniref:BolA-like protein n=1 Tax=Naegleria fowleri TaxID=5763 RepID=A0A6A5BDN0_NAEFO|nr:uncharacterized protein FDP41_005920 [Naegleria fowleri]KAF0975167.1 hypothetical protein FDP41_005920 [Naegleria fowleri]CAG4719159.1 unnamed protein product [Naegleria fowleri]
MSLLFGNNQQQHLTRSSRILKLLSSRFSPTKISIKNISRPYENDGAHNEIVSLAHGESHFRVMIVSSEFEGVGPLARHRMIHQVLNEEFKSGLHALTITAKSVQEYEKAKERMKNMRKEKHSMSNEESVRGGGWEHRDDTTDMASDSCCNDEMEELFGVK